jgi:putative component of membrane protein insertase Oxa1/YidC/SpoIIIJ protein YidD
VNSTRKVRMGAHSIELDVDATLESSVLRAFTGTTPHDAAVDVLHRPVRPLWLRGAVASLRWYRRRIGQTLGHRCVFEPSCSRFAELALRQNGLWRGGWEVSRRLRRCRPGLGGVDLPVGVTFEEDYDLPN